MSLYNSSACSPPTPVEVYRVSTAESNASLDCGYYTLPPLLDLARREDCREKARWSLEQQHREENPVLASGWQVLLRTGILLVNCEG